MPGLKAVESRSVVLEGFSGGDIPTVEDSVRNGLGRAGLPWV